MPGRRIRMLMILADIAAVPIALFFAYLLRYGNRIFSGFAQPTPWAPLVIGAGALGVWFSIYELMSLDCFREGWRLRATVSRVTLATAIQLGVILAVAYLSRLYYSRLVLAYFAVLFCTVVLLVRLITYRVLCSRHRAGKTRRIVIIGEGRVAAEIVRRIERHPELSYEVIGLLNHSIPLRKQRDGNSDDRSDNLSSFDVLSTLKREGVAELIVALDEPPPLELLNFLSLCREQRICVNLVPQPYELYASRARFHEIEGVPLVSLQAPPDFRMASAFKRVFDLFFGLIFCVFALPILAVSSVVLKFQGRRLLHRELRCGQHGKPFWMYRLDVDRGTVDASRFQYFLCRLSISELPQLFNVLLGQMGLVGPRPETLERVREYSDWQGQRLKIRPGMTGLAQVNGLREQHLSEEKTHYDLQYVVRWTPIIDLVLLFETVWTLAARFSNPAPKPLDPFLKSDRHSAVLPRSAAQ